jgi:glyceraldehyde 3-phosphate dehydrogenase
VPLVSIDYNGNPLSSIVDVSCTRVIDDNMVKIISWYDKETGFSHRSIDLLALIASEK